MLFFCCCFECASKPSCGCFLLAFVCLLMASLLSSLQEIFGGNATSDEYQIGRHVANSFVAQTYEGQSDIHSKF